MGNIADKILAADDLPEEQVETPEWASSGVPTLRVRGLTAFDRDAYERSLLIRTEDGGYTRDPNLKNVRAKLVARCVVDENGKRVFQDQQIDALGKKNAAVVDRLWNAARRLSGMADEEENPSSGDQDGSSSSESPTPSGSLTSIDSRSA